MPDPGRLTPLRGRSAALAAIDEALGKVEAGRQAVLLIDGGPGLGKSRLLEESAGRARRAGIRVGIGRADPDDRVVPIASLMAALSDGPEPLLDRQAVGQLRALRDQRYWLLFEIEALLERVALEHPLLVGLDDLQWADSGTIEALRVLPGRLASLPILWVAAYRTGEASGGLLRAVAELADAGGSRMILEPLDRAAVEEVVADVMKAEADDALLELVGNAHGSPFLLVELLRGLQEEGLVRVDGSRAVLVETRLPARVRDSLRHRLEPLSAPARRAAVTASALGRTFRFEDLAAMLDVAPSLVVDPVEELTRAEILIESGAKLAFRHDLIRQAVLDGVPAAARRALDRQAAEVLLKAGALPLEIATRLSASAEPGDELAITTLRRAAQALAPTDPGMASELTSKALALTADNAPGRVQLVVDTAILLHAAGRAGEGREFAASALSRTLNPEHEAEVRLSIATMYSVPGDVRVESGQRALALPGLSDTMRARHLATLVLNLVAAGRVSDADLAAVEAEDAVRATRDRGAELSLELGRLALDECGYRYGAMLQRIARIDDLCAAVGDQMPARAAAWFRPNALVALDRLDEALEVANTELAAAHRDHQGWIAPRWEICRGWLLLQQGHLSDAGAALEGALAVDATPDPLAILPDAVGLLALARVAIHTGSEGLGQRCTGIARATLAVDTADTRRHLVWLLALQALARGDAKTARDELAALADGGGCVLPLLARDVGCEPELARIAVGSDDADLAEAAISSAEDRARCNPGVMSTAAAAATCRGLLRNDADELAAAVELLGTGSRPLMLASAQEDLGRVLVEQEHKAAGIEALGRALELYADADATWDSRRVRGRLRALGVRRRFVATERPEAGWAALTDSELEVARLVARGLTNREAAEHLFVSPHTVNTHLRHVFTKLAVNSRVELARLAMQHDQGV